VWAGLHALGNRNVAVTPITWPTASMPPAPSREPSVPLSAAVPSPAPSADGVPGVPVLPGALQQLNSSTRDTAVGLYALIQQLEQALGTHLKQLAQQLEPGR
jgi:hypothetical protein